jgi:hypothetical protein
MQPVMLLLLKAARTTHSDWHQLVLQQLCCWDFTVHVLQPVLLLLVAAAAGSC